MLVFGVSQCVVYVFIKDKGFALFSNKKVARKMVCGLCILICIQTLVYKIKVCVPVCFVLDPSLDSG